MGAVPPTRGEVEAWWRAVLAEKVTREAGHHWAEPLMLADYGGPSTPDLLAMTGLQYLHGFDMTWQDLDHHRIAHGPPGEYVKPLSEIAADLDHWLGNCRHYDADPEAWAARARSRARDADQ
jgi:hypothetical protein